jgi:hypothetical protein
MQPPARAEARRPLRPGQVGGLARGWSAWLTRGREERVGFWLGRTLLVREAGVLMRSLWPLNAAVAAVLLGLGADQFADPLRETEPRLVALPIFAVYLIALAAPAILYNLSFSRESEACWVLRAAPLARPAGLVRGLGKAVMLLIIAPLCGLLAVVAVVRWHDPLAAVLHAVLAGLLSWLLALAAIGLGLIRYPFALPPARGGTMGALAVPLLILSSLLLPVAALHMRFAASPYFWLAALVLGLAAAPFLSRWAEARFVRSGRVEA